MQKLSHETVLRKGARMSKKDLAEVIREAQENGEEVSLAIFVSRVSKVTLRAAYLLAASITLKPSELEHLLMKIWHVRPSTAETAMRELGSWPFVFGRRWQLREPFDDEERWHVESFIKSPFLARFQREEPKAFRRACQLLADHESLRSEEDFAFTPQNDWFRGVRYAVLLAGCESDESLDVLDGLANAHVGDLLWMCDLFLERKTLYRDHPKWIKYIEKLQKTLKTLPERPAPPGYQKLLESSP